MDGKTAVTGLVVEDGHAVLWIDQVFTSPWPNIGQRIKHLRGSRSQRSLATEAGISNSTWSKVESGKIRPSMETLVKMARVLEEPVDKLWVLAGHATFGPP